MVWPELLFLGVVLSFTCVSFPSVFLPSAILFIHIALRRSVLFFATGLTSMHFKYVCGVLKSSDWFCEIGGFTYNPA